VVELQKELAAARDTLQLSPTDVDRVAVKALKIDLTKFTVSGGAFAGETLEFGDVVMAAWVSGAIDSELLKACLTMQALGEPRDSILKEVATHGWQIAQAVSVVNPISLYAVTIASIIITSVEQAKERKKEESDDGSLVGG